MRRGRERERKRKKRKRTLSSQNNRAIPCRSSESSCRCGPRIRRTWRRAGTIDPDKVKLIKEAVWDGQEGRQKALRGRLVENKAKALASYFSANRREKKNIRDQTKRIRVRAYYIVPSRLELTLDYCHATRHARWRKGGVIDTPRKAPRVKGKKPSGAESRACVRGWVSGERKIKDKREEDCQGVGWVQANDLYGNRGNSMIASR